MENKERELGGKTSKKDPEEGVKNREKGKP